MKPLKHRALPIEPSEQMIEAAYPLLSSMTGGTPRLDKDIIRAIWTEMLEAAPPPLIQGLTKNQGRVHQFIEEYIAEHNLSPTFQEMADHLGFGCKSDVFVVVEALIKKKILKRRQKGQQRSLVVLVPTGMTVKKQRKP